MNLLARQRSFLASIGLAAALVRCSSGTATRGEELVGQASAELSSIPAGVQCIRIAVAGSSTVTSLFNVSSSSSTTLPLSGLPLGMDTFVGDAFSTPCSGIAAASPTWVTNPVVANVAAGMSFNVALAFVANGQGSVNVSFGGGSGGGSLPNTVSCNSTGCVCTTGFGNCDGTLVDGCEANLGSDPNNCGACGNSCGGGTCMSGACSAPVVCAAQTSLAVAANVTVPVTWPATTTINAGSGTAHVWLLSQLTPSGNQFTGQSQICGLSVPDVNFDSLGSIAAGGSKANIAIPSSVWAAATMPTYASTGSQAGWGPPSSFAVSPGLALVGLALPSSVNAATLAWPSSSWSFPSGTTFADSDGDTNPGITSTPLSGMGYVLPPTAVGLGGSAPGTDKVYLATRIQMSLSGAWTSCTNLSGSATVSLFDNHVVGCHINGGSACTTGAANTQADFVDQNRAVYAPGSATFVGTTLSGTATCADALAAVP